MISIGRWSYSFTSFVNGIPLDPGWGTLTTENKSHVREQLNHIFTKLRQPPLPSQEGYLGGGIPQLCKGGHNFRRTSALPIVGESQFNDFLLEDSYLEPARANYLRQNLPHGHRIVTTYGDLCPVNILIEDQNIMRITGIVDWETAGAHPEYWEYINAFRLRYKDGDDWFLYLPEAVIGRFFDE